MQPPKPAPTSRRTPDGPADGFGSVTSLSVLTLQAFQFRDSYSSASRRWAAFAVASAQGFHNLGTQPEACLRQSQKGIFKILIADDDHWTACRNSNDLRASSMISSADCAGQAPRRESAACASQRDSSSSNLRTCSSERMSFAYASAANASRAARPRFLNPAPSSAARSSGMFTVNVIDEKLSQTASPCKSEKSSSHS